jgi:murein DD-endopeptidase MepM/ murein hydrolase activator NlpD
MKSKNIYNLPIKIKDKAIAFSDIRVHCGIDKHAIDFPLEKNVPILATQSGKIIRVKDDAREGGDNEKYTAPKYQNNIVIKHANDEYTEYIHLDYKSALVKEGDLVKKGQPIAKGIGMVGYTTELHLHFVVFKLADKKYNFESIPVAWEKDLVIEKQKNQFFLQLNFKKLVGK